MTVVGHAHLPTPLVVVEHAKRSVCHLNCLRNDLHPRAGDVSEAVRAHVVKLLAGCRCAPDLRKVNAELHVIHRWSCSRAGTHGRFEVEP